MTDNSIEEFLLKYNIKPNYKYKFGNNVYNIKIIIDSFDDTKLYSLSSNGKLKLTFDTYKSNDYEGFIEYLKIIFKSHIRKNKFNNIING